MLGLLAARKELEDSGNAVTITGAGTRGRTRALGFTLPSFSQNPSLPFYSVLRLCYLYCIAEVCFSSRAFLFLNVEQAAWGIGITV